MIEQVDLKTKQGDHGKYRSNSSISSNEEGDKNTFLYHWVIINLTTESILSS